MIRKITGFLFILLLFFLDIYFFDSIFEFSRIYPFNRAISGNALTYKIDFGKESLPYGAEIIGIENSLVDKANLFYILGEQKNNKEVNITYKSGMYLHNINIAKERINYDYFGFLLYLLLIANVHFIWALVLYMRGGSELRIKIYFPGSILFSLIFYSLIEKLTFGRFEIVNLLFILFCGFFIVYIGHLFANRSIPKSSLAVLTATSVALIFYSYKNFKTLEVAIPYKTAIAYLVLCCLYTFYLLVSNINSDIKSYSARRNSVIIIVFVVGFIIPITAIIMSLDSAYSFSIVAASAMTAIFPVFIGYSFLKYSYYDYYGLKVLRQSDLQFIFSTVIISILSSYILYLAIETSFSFDYYFGIIFKVFIAVFITIFFTGLYFINIKLGKQEIVDKDIYSNSLQKIAELVSFHYNLANKLENIFLEIKKLTNAVSINLITFTDSKNKYNEDLSKYIENIPRDFELVKFLENVKGIIFRFALIRSSKIEEVVYNFFIEKNIIIMFPVYKGKEVKCALCVSEKTGSGLYTDNDVSYFETVVHQLYQLVENDNLYKEYITKHNFEKEMDNASFVQLRFFPKKPPEKSMGLDISYFYRPFTRVIGDYFDFFEVDNNRTAVIIGDVSGHGLSASMILSAVNSITYAMLRDGKSLEYTFYEINSFLNNSYKGIELITLFVGIYDKSERTMEYINAGHGSPILVKRNKNELLFVKGRSKILGADPKAEYCSSKITLESQDEMLLFTDGLLDIYDAKSVPVLNEDKIIKIIYDNMGYDIEGKIMEIERHLKSLDEFIKDDITLIGVAFH